MSAQTQIDTKKMHTHQYVYKTNIKIGETCNLMHNTKRSLEEQRCTTQCAHTKSTPKEQNEKYK